MEALAAAAGVGERTIYRLNKGGNGRLEVLDLVATALGAPLTALIDRPLCAPAPPVAGTRYSVHITVSGTTQTAEQSLALPGAASSAANHIEKAGATVSGYESTITSTPDGSVKHRALACVWLQMPDSRPAWAIIAVRLDAVGPFMLAEAEGHLDLYNLAPFGEVVVSDYGLVPPDEVIAKVAIMFRVDGWQLRRRTMVRSDIHAIKAGLSGRGTPIVPDTKGDETSS